ncbi:immunoglobulin I-set domain protein [Onchocerca flexuosa]|uniref:Immunoglobulin I-set domain protein n=2 Tax=Onchocerca flexuosa TaxID=387005 RepID=A0A238C4L0_9BILA|nr:immunoglobulin I-set domain protein [Onchocerca flexuosa]
MKQIRSILAILVIFFGFSCNIILAGSNTFAQGNLEVLFNATSVKSGDDYPLKASVPNLWCQAMSNRTQQLIPIKEAHFVRDLDKEILPAIIYNQTRAILEFGNTSIWSAGKYRCEITTEEDELVWGWLFVNMRPVFHVNNSKTLEAVGDNHFHVKTSILRATEGETVTINCPVRGFPEPTIKWYKNDVPVAEIVIASTEQVTFLEKGLQISKIEFDDEGIYSCVAQNSFSKILDGKVILWESRLDHELKVKSSYRWIYPLIVIIILFLLLFIVIYACSAFNRYKTYNVEKRERRKKRQANLGYNENMSQQQPILDYNNDLE